ncbi:glutamate racemase [Hydrogenophaga soli]
MLLPPAVSAASTAVPVAASAIFPVVDATAPLGVFDSGLGGLSVLRAIHQALPGEDLLYVADSGHAPYGDRDAAYIIERSMAMVDFLVGQGAKAVVVACNTATVVAVSELRQRIQAHAHIPIVALEPAIKPAAALTRSGVVGVLATTRTVNSPSVARLCAQFGQGVDIRLQACPGLVTQVERGELDTPATRELVQTYVQPLVEAGADTLVLGCTHYPFLEPLIREVAGPGVTLVESSAAVARELTRRTEDRRHPQHASRTGEVRFFTTDDVAQARTRMSTLWGQAVQVQAVNAED